MCAMCVSTHRTAALGSVLLLVLHHAHHVGLTQVIQQLQCMQRRSTVVRRAHVRRCVQIPHKSSHGKPSPHQCICMTALHNRPSEKILAKKCWLHMAGPEKVVDIDGQKCWPMNCLPWKLAKNCCPKRLSKRAAQKNAAQVIAA